MHDGEGDWREWLTVAVNDKGIRELSLSEILDPSQYICKGEVNRSNSD